MPITINTGIQYIDIDEFTNNVVINENNEYYPVTGDGIFDDLMETATKHLLAQYKANRIRGENFATAYAHIYEVTLQAALSAWLQKPEQAAKVELLNAQTALTEAQKLNVEADTLLKGAQKLLIDAQKALTTAQAAHEPSKKANTEADTALKNAQAQYIAKQKDAAAKDIELKEAQTQSEVSKRDLYVRQIEGFDEDFKQKLLKIGLDSWAVGFSVAKDTVAPNANMIPAAMTKTALDDLWNQAIVPEVDIKTYKRSEDIVNSSSTIIPSGSSGSGG